MVGILTFRITCKRFAPSTLAASISSSGTPAKAAMYITAFGDCATNGNLTHTTTSFTMAYKYSYGTAYAVSFNVNVYGKWK